MQAIREYSIRKKCVARLKLILRYLFEFGILDISMLRIRFVNCEISVNNEELLTYSFQNIHR